MKTAVKTELKSLRRRWRTEATEHRKLWPDYAPPLDMMEYRWAEHVNTLRRCAKELDRVIRKMK